MTVRLSLRPEPYEMRYDQPHIPHRNACAPSNDHALTATKTISLTRPHLYAQVQSIPFPLISKFTLSPRPQKPPFPHGGDRCKILHFG